MKCGKCSKDKELWQAEELGNISFSTIKHLIEPYDNGLCEECLLGMIPKYKEKQEN